MTVRQISIFLENRAGRLAEVTGVLGRAGVNIRALSLADTADFGILRLIVDDPNRALSALSGSGFTVHETGVVAVEVPDEPGGLAHIVSLLDDAGINVEYMYAFVEKSADRALVVFRFDDPDAAVEALTSKGIGVLTEKQVSQL